MREHPIPPVNEPLQYRAIGIVRGLYRPEDTDQFTRGRLVDAKGVEIEAVTLGRVLTLMRRHLVMEDPHLWVVYPRCRDVNQLHLQIAGIWEPRTLSRTNEQELKSNALLHLDQLPEGDDYFSIRGELIYSRPDSNDLVVRIRQRPRSNLSRPLPFKLLLKGNIPFESIRNFVSLQVRRVGQELHVEDYEVIGPIPSRGSKRKGARGSKTRNGPKNN